MLLGWLCSVMLVPLMPMFHFLNVESSFKIPALVYCIQIETHYGYDIIIIS